MRRGHRRTLVAAVVALLACLVSSSGASAAGGSGPDASGTFVIDGTEVFPITLSKPPQIDSRTPWGTDGLAEVASAGVNLLKIGPPPRVPWTEAAVADVQKWNESAAARGMHTWVDLRELAHAQPGTPEEALLRTLATRVKDSPGMGMWKGADEPWWTGLAWYEIQHAYAVAKSIDPVHPWVLIQAPRGTELDLAPYTGVTDAHGVDIYPVRYGLTNPDLHRVGRWTRRIASITPGKPVFTVLQVCYSGSFDRMGSGAYVLPTREQERYMAYDAIVNGARGLFFYGGDDPHCFNGTDAAVGWNWTFWNAVLKNLILEVGPKGLLQPALLAPGPGLRLSSDNRTTQLWNRRVGTDIWVIAARHGVGTRRVTVKGLPRSIRSGRVYWEGRSVRVRNGVFTDTFRQWGVHVYRFRR